jgi:hypothetical protein
VENIYDSSLSIEIWWKNESRFEFFEFRVVRIFLQPASMVTAS